MPDRRVADQANADIGSVSMRLTDLIITLRRRSWLLARAATLGPIVCLLLASPATPLALGPRRTPRAISCSPAKLRAAARWWSGSRPTVGW